MNCGAVLMIDMDGQVQLADKSDAENESAAQADAEIAPAAQADAESEPAIEDAPLEESPFENSMTAEAPETGSSFEPFAAESEAPPAEDASSLAGEGEVTMEPMASFEAPPEEPIIAEESAVEEQVTEQQVTEEPPPADDNANWFDQGLDAPPPEPEATPVAANDFSDVSEFGNQDVDMGALQFELTLSGIDHKDLRAEVMDVLSDPRLYLNLKDHPIRNGTITLPGLNAARTSLIVTRLQHLNLQFHWKQKAYEA